VVLGWGPVVNDDSSEHAQQLTAAANQGITEQFGEQPVPLRAVSKGTAETREALALAGVPLAFACAALKHLGATRKTQEHRPPKTLKYFAEAVVDLWRDTTAREQAAAAVVPELPEHAATFASDNDRATEELFARIERGELLDV
jgi:hypothetical protein